jgi:hypothetical protein
VPTTVALATQRQVVRRATRWARVRARDYVRAGARRGGMMLIGLVLALLTVVPAANAGSTGRHVTKRARTRPTTIKLSETVGCLETEPSLCQASSRRRRPHAGTVLLLERLPIRQGDWSASLVEPD